MRIAIITDAWHPQKNGVVTALSNLKKELELLKHEILIIEPSFFKTIPCPFYPEIPLAINPFQKINELLDSFAPEGIHIATEGPLGIAGRHYCVSGNHPFTTTYHTRFPEYVQQMTGVPARITIKLLHRFHEKARCTMVTTETLRDELVNHGFKNVVVWPLGVDTKLFKPRPKTFIEASRPVHLCVGRVAKGKNLEAFLSLSLPGTKYVVGGGPLLQELKKTYPDVRFVGPVEREELACYYAASDVFVFPSKTETFGMVMLEANASGIPVAAFPVPGPLDYIENGVNGFLYEDLASAIERCYSIESVTCREVALRYSWEKSAEQFVKNFFYPLHVHSAEKKGGA